MMEKLSKPSILIVDDLRENLLQLSQLLKDLHAVIHMASNHREAMAIASNTELALIILDVEMPEVNGYELANLIKSQTKNKIAPIIFLSAVFYDEMHIYKGYELGAVDYLTKPLNRDILLSKVNVFLRLEQVRSDLIRSEALYQSIVEDQTDLVFRSGPDYCITFANNAICKLLQKPVNEVLGLNMFEIVVPADIDVASTALRSLSPDNQIVRFEHRIDNGKQAESWVHHTLRVFYEAGEIVEFQSVCHDISDLKRSNSELKAAQLKAQEETQVKSMFLANMSHEIRTPMSGILAMAEMLKTTELNEEQAEHVNLICQSSSNLLGIINDVLDFSKIEANQISITPSRVAIQNMLQNSAKLYKQKAEEKGNIIRVLPNPSLPEVAILDEVKISQILNNLVNNAIKFTSNGVVTLTCQLLSASEYRMKLKFAVTDTGAGINEAQKSRLFKPFVQADNQLTNSGGTGLGLAICKKLVEKMDGEIGLHSVMGEGSEFWFTVFSDTTVVPTHTREVCQPDRQLATSIRPLKVLVVEDNLLNQKVALATLRKLGHTADCAENGQIGYETYVQRPYDLVIMDIQMPVMNGLDAAKAIREAEQTQKIKPAVIIALSANVTESYRQACLAAGMNDFISKPFRFEDFAKTIQKHFSK
jgi:PAS domain S-box-containing protein